MKLMRLTRGLMLTAWMLVMPSLMAQLASDPASKVYMWLEGASMGRILGEVITPGREDSHSVLAYSHEILAPYDAASGLPTGKRQHQPFRVVKLLNRGSPRLVEALAMNERLTSVRFEVWAPSLSGKDFKLLTYELRNARLISVRPWMPNKSDAATVGYPPAEEIAFVYESITVTFEDGGVTFTDDWVAPAS
ncbi:MAG: type VI secretion system tube protein Hcp [Verrucomicrobia bacterium]|nr:type VI secretion system tube protein Hcp [Verrucomicrobiota bacterium]